MVEPMSKACLFAARPVLFLVVTVALFLAGTPRANAAACDAGTSAGFACSHVEFLGHLSPAEMGGDGEVLNDIWGWVDPLSNEAYAIVGMQDGTAFVRISSDGTPLFLGRLPASDGQADVAKAGTARVEKSCHDEVCGEGESSWRDIKVYDHYAYIVSEAAGHGVQIFDLARLRALTGNPTQPLSQDGFYSDIGHAHNLFINEETKRAYIVGHDGNGRAGGLHILDLTEPLNPAFLGEVNNDGYTHDVQCVVYSGPDPDIAAGSELCFASNEDTLTIWDVTDAGEPILVSKSGYSESGYTHQGWLSDDQHHFFLNDELDELNSGTRTHLRVFDVSDVDNPALAADYLAPTLAIDHNNYVHGRWLYQSNYGAGLRILDILDPLHPVEAAYFDSQPTDTAEFYGNWSNFRFPGGITVISDIHDGLFVLRPVIDESGIAPDVSVALSLAESETAAGSTVDGEASLSVDAASDARDILVTFHLPAGAVFTAVTAPDGWNCNRYDNSRVQKCRHEQPVAGGEPRFDFTVKRASAGTVEVIAMAYANAADANPSDNLASAHVTFTSNTSMSGGSGGGAFGVLLPGLLLAAGRRRFSFGA